ncbi:MAG: hypothetical protein K2G40_08190, partial [Muribaculaceae bacterium]|nr:hypothetical protein [Muribaculaceae bacterium]
MKILRHIKGNCQFSRSLLLLLTVLVAVSIVSCGNDDVFEVQANIEGLGTQNVRIIYRDGDRMRSTIAMALDGKFSFTGVSKQFTIVDIYTTNRALLGSLVAKNGDNIELTMKLNEPASFNAKGNKISEELSNFLSKNKDLFNNHEVKEINYKIADYVRRNPDNPASAFLLFTQFSTGIDKLLADSLIHSINEERLPSKDFIEAFTASLISPADTIKNISLFSFYNITGDSVTNVSFPGKKGMMLALID